MKCVFCNKELGEKDHCSAVNKYTFKKSKDYWKKLHDRFGTHIVLQGEPIFLKPVAEAPA